MNSINSQRIEEYLSIKEYSKNLFSVSDISDDKRLEYYKIQARTVGADYVYFLDNELENRRVPFVYIYDERAKTAEEKIPLYKINKQIWTSGEIALAVVVYSDEIKIIDTRKPISEKEEVSFLIESINEIDKELKSRIFEGRILEEARGNYVKNSPYQKLLDHIEKNILDKVKEIGCEIGLLKKILVKFILIKYLEEQKDDNGKSVFQERYFNQFLKNSDDKPANFCDVLRDGGDIIGLLGSLNKQLNGGVFEINEQDEIRAIRESNLNLVANALDGDKEPDGQLNIWPLYDFKLLPIEFISRLYERFVVSLKGKQKKDGAYYTPPHLARLLIDELLPFDKEINFNKFKLLDPSCGSGIFLVLAYKRLITLWLLGEGKQKITGVEDINAIQKILANCIYGLDINKDALSITATSLQIELTSHLQPKDIWKALKFDDLQQKGNLKGGIGFFKWYKSQDIKFDIIVGNPPFNIDNDENVRLGIDDDIGSERFVDCNDKERKFPNKNPALAILYISLESLLSSDGSLFFIMPASATLYNSTTVNYRKALFSKWDIEKIYDFTPLRNNLWSGADVATIAMLVQPNKKTEFTQHIIVRSNVANKDGALRFEIDKYDKYKVSIQDILTKDYIWKSNLLGGGRITFYIGKYRNKEYYSSIEDFLKLKKKSHAWIYQDGAGSSFNKKSEDIKDIKLPLLKSKEFKEDGLRDNLLDKSPTGTYLFYNKEMYYPPNLLIKNNIKHGLPTIFNNQLPFIFDNSFFGIKCPKKDASVLEKFNDIFKKNRSTYKFLITTTSSKTFLQKNQNSLINSKDIKSLPIRLNSKGDPIPLDKISHIERAVMEDTDLMAECLSKTKGKLFEPVIEKELIQYGVAFCEIINCVYQNGDFKFRQIRRVIGEDFVWITFEHTDENKEVVQAVLGEETKEFQKILVDDILNNGLRINRVITYYGEKNRISFIKPIKLKFWTRSIGYRDAENVKADMLKNGY